MTAAGRAPQVRHIRLTTDPSDMAVSAPKTSVRNGLTVSKRKWGDKNLSVSFFVRLIANSNQLVLNIERSPFFRIHSLAQSYTIDKSWHLKKCISDTQRSILAGSKLFYDNASLLRWLNKDKNSIRLENHDVIFLCAALPAKVHSELCYYPKSSKKFLEAEYCIESRIKIWVLQCHGT